MCGLVWRELDGRMRWGPKRQLTVTFQNSSRLGSSGLERRETDWFVVCFERMCLELVKND